MAASLALVDTQAPITPAFDIPIRHMNFQFDSAKADDKFYLKAELATAYFEALSIFLTFGEDLVIDTARHHRELIKDPELKRRVTVLIGQEAIHSRVHDEWNEILAQHRFPVPLYRFLGGIVFKYGFNRFPQPLKLSMMAGIEHFTAVIAEFMMKHEDHFFETDDEQQRALWMWHMLEESEHKDIAYDVYQSLSGHYPLRVIGFLIAAITIMALVPFAASLIPPMRKPTTLLNPQYWKDVKRSLSLLLDSKEGIFGSTFSHIIDYLRPDFHPNDHDTQELIAYYRERLLNPKTGLLTPYFTREFMPSLRA
jgi:predicted metal-dependent hydrolase